MTTLQEVPVWIRPFGRIWHILESSKGGWNSFLCWTLTPNVAEKSSTIPTGPKCVMCRDRLKTARLIPQEIGKS